MHDTFGEQTNLKCLENRFRRSHESLAIIYTYTRGAPENYNKKKKQKKEKAYAAEEIRTLLSVVFNSYCGFP